MRLLVSAAALFATILRANCASPPTDSTMKSGSLDVHEYPLDLEEHVLLPHKRCSRSPHSAQLVTTALVTALVFLVFVCANSLRDNSKRSTRALAAGASGPCGVVESPPRSPLGITLQLNKLSLSETDAATLEENEVASIEAARKRILELSARVHELKQRIHDLEAKLELEEQRVTDTRAKCHTGKANPKNVRTLEKKTSTIKATLNSWKAELRDLEAQLASTEYTKEQGMLTLVEKIKRSEGGRAISVEAAAALGASVVVHGGRRDYVVLSPQKVRRALKDLQESLTRQYAAFYQQEDQTREWIDKAEDLVSTANDVIDASQQLPHVTLPPGLEMDLRKLKDKARWRKIREALLEELLDEAPMSAFSLLNVASLKTPAVSKGLRSERRGKPSLFLLPEAVIKQQWQLSLIDPHKVGMYADDLEDITTAKHRLEGMHAIVKNVNNLISEIETNVETDETRLRNELSTVEDDSPPLQTRRLREDIRRDQECLARLKSVLSNALSDIKTVAYDDSQYENSLLLRVRRRNIGIPLTREGSFAIVAAQVVLGNEQRGDKPEPQAEAATGEGTEFVLPDSVLQQMRQLQLTRSDSECLSSEEFEKVRQAAERLHDMQRGLSGLKIHIRSVEESIESKINMLDRLTRDVLQGQSSSEEYDNLRAEILRDKRHLWQLRQALSLADQDMADVGYTIGQSIKTEKEHSHRAAHGKPLTLEAAAAVVAADVVFGRNSANSEAESWGEKPPLSASEDEAAWADVLRQLQQLCLTESEAAGLSAAETKKIHDARCLLENKHAEMLEKKAIIEELLANIRVSEEQYMAAPEGQSAPEADVSLQTPIVRNKQLLATLLDEVSATGNYLRAIQYSDSQDTMALIMHAERQLIGNPLTIAGASAIIAADVVLEGQSREEQPKPSLMDEPKIMTAVACAREKAEETLLNLEMSEVGNYRDLGLLGKAEVVLAHTKTIVGAAQLLVDKNNEIVSACLQTVSRLQDSINSFRGIQAEHATRRKRLQKIIFATQSRKVAMEFFAQSSADVQRALADPNPDVDYIEKLYIEECRMSSQIEDELRDLQRDEGSLPQLAQREKEIREQFEGVLEKSMENIRLMEAVLLRAWTSRTGTLFSGLVEAIKKMQTASDTPLSPEVHTAGSVKRSTSIRSIFKKKKRSTETTQELTPEQSTTLQDLQNLNDMRIKSKLLLNHFKFLSRFRPLNDRLCEDLRGLEVKVGEAEMQMNLAVRAFLDSVAIPVERDYEKLRELTDRLEKVVEGDKSGRTGKIEKALWDNFSELNVNIQANVEKCVFLLNELLNRRVSNSFTTEIGTVVREILRLRSLLITQGQRRGYTSRK